MRDNLPELFFNSPQVVLSHSHLDHTGGAYEFAACFAHPRYRTDTKQASLKGADLLPGLGSTDAELSTTLPEMLIDALPNETYDPLKYELLPPNKILPLQDGDTIDLGDYVFSALHLPGHTSDTIALFEEREGTLFSGDFIYDGLLLDDLIDSNVEDYIESMERVKELDVCTVYPGHGQSFNNARLQELIRSYIQRCTE